MKTGYSVTFEFPTRPPLTHRGHVDASQVPTCCARALRQAVRALQPRHWTSVVVCLDKHDFKAVSNVEDMA